MHSELHLPPPPPELLQLSQQLGEKIIKTIDRYGPMPFDQYMQMALYEPGLGYYVNGLHKLGQHGDFVTAPEQGSLFASALVRQIDELFTAAVPTNDPWVIVELGAGTGVLARDILTRLKQSSTAYWILEPSASLREIQYHTLSEAGLTERVVWLSEPPTEPFGGVVIGNEVIDALPTKRWRLDSEGVSELAVGLADNPSDNPFRWVSTPAPPRLDQAVSSLIDRLPSPLPMGYESEYLIDLEPWLTAVTEHLQSGTVLLIDYGYNEQTYYHPERSEGTLVCHYRHRAHFDPFVWPGLTDISSFVDFSALSRAASDFDRIDFATQAEFVLAHGLHHEVANIEDDSLRLKTMGELKRLVLPGEMGEKFKIMGLTRGAMPQMTGFSGSIE
jgi:SAM-dependent MidA family methyltransferase